MNLNSGLTDLLFNPVTLIALLLAGFFTLMAFLRSKETRRKQKEQRSVNGNKPYRVSDPFGTPHVPVVTPPPSGPTLNTLPASETDTDNPRKFFRQFGPTPDGSGGASPTTSSGYTWE